MTFEHYTQQQRVWIYRRWRAGGNVWLLICVAQQWMLFDGERGALLVGKVPREKLESIAARIWRNGLIDAELISALTSPRARSKVD